MTADLVLRGATVVDGTGAPGVRADVAVRDGRIVDVGTVGLPGTGGVEVDLEGLVLAPGFIDVHTHYDAQVLWDRDLTPSSWHGVTTVVIGNCGFGIAPTRPADRDHILRMLENVEGMSLETLTAGLEWTFETYPEYLDALDAAPTRANVVSLLGHSPLRLYVLGEDGAGRTATPAEVGEMRRLLAEGLAAGAAGFATSRSLGAVGAHGRPVPSRSADAGELDALAAVLGEQARGTFVAATGPDLGPDELSAIHRRIGRPVTWCAIMASSRNRDGVRAAVARLDELDDVEVFPQIACRPIVIELALGEPDAFANIPAFAEVLQLPREDRRGPYADVAWRARAWRELLERRGDVLSSAVIVDDPDERTLAERTGAGGSPLDTMAEVALARGLETRFRFVLNNDDEEELARLLRNRRLMVGLSDAGAHATQICDAGYATHLLSYWVRDRGALPLELAVWRLTGQPAAAFGLHDRGRIAPGFVADLVAFDPATVASTPIERVQDQPAGGDRLVTRGTGIEHVWVAGTATVRGGEVVEGARPGGLLRSAAQP